MSTAEKRTAFQKLLRNARTVRHVKRIVRRRKQRTVSGASQTGNKNPRPLEFVDDVMKGRRGK